MRVLFIHVNYNNSQKTIDCVASIFANIREGIDVYVIIVDNDSREEEKNILSEWHRALNDSRVKIYFSEKNLGYFPGLNYGLQRYKGLDEIDYVIIGNNDLVFDTSFLSRLSGKTYPDDVFVVCPDTINSDGRHRNPAVIQKYSRLRLLHLDLYFASYYIVVFMNFINRIIPFRGDQIDRPGYDKSQYICLGLGACYILTKNYIKQIRSIPTYIFLMNEEPALSDEVFRHQGRIYYDVDLIVNHREHSSVGRGLSKPMYKLGQKSYKILKKHVKLHDLYDKSMRY